MRIAWSLSSFASGGTVWANDGTGTFQQAQSFSTAKPRAAGDVDGDGDLDLLATDPQAGANGLYLLRNLGGLAFRTEVVLARAVQQRCGSVPALADSDGDGDLDIVAETEYFGLIVRVFVNTGGTFAPGFIAQLPQDTRNYTAAAGDVTGDGVPDLVFGNSDLSTVNTAFVMAGLGNGQFAAPVTYRTGGQFRGLSDLDGDGDLDLSGDGLVRSRTYRGPDAGERRQFGAATPGTGSVPMVLGAHGIARIGNSVQLRGRHAFPGAGILTMGLQELALRDFPVPGVNIYALPIVTLGVTLTGTATPGGGRFDFNLSPAAPGWFGARVLHQVFALDPGAAHGLVSSNALALTWGR